MIHYRSFRNWDPPSLVRIWNRCAGPRGMAGPIRVEAFDALVLSKPYFDLDGLIVALEDDRPVGYAHAGFGTTPQEDALDRQFGVTSAVLVEPDYRRQGIGRELLRRSERYLTSRGAQVIYAGEMHPLNPFYLGLYGGSELPGFLDSSTEARPFLEAEQYKRLDECLVLERPVAAPLKGIDMRMLRIGRRTHLEVDDGLARRSWWWASTMGAFEQLHFRLVANADGRKLAEAIVWDMHLLSQKWQRHTVGLAGVSVVEDQRRQGLAKYLMSEILRRLSEQFISMIQVQTMRRNTAALGLYQVLGFEQIDQGAIYRKQ